MKGIILIVTLIVIIGSLNYGIKRLEPFLKANRRKRKNYEYYFTDEDD